MMLRRQFRSFNFWFHPKFNQRNIRVRLVKKRGHRHGAAPGLPGGGSVLAANSVGCHNKEHQPHQQQTGLQKAHQPRQKGRSRHIAGAKQVPAPAKGIAQHGNGVGAVNKNKAETEGNPADEAQRHQAVGVIDKQAFNRRFQPGYGLGERRREPEKARQEEQVDGETSWNSNGRKQSVSALNLSTWKIEAIIYRVISKTPVG